MKMELPLTRREAVRRMLLLAGATMVGSRAFLRGENLATWKIGDGFSAADIALLDEIGETILPATDIPGAKEVQIGAFMAMMVTECYTDDEQAEFVAGLQTIDQECQRRFGVGFQQASAEQRTAVAEKFDREAWAFSQSQSAKSSSPKPVHFFTMFKDLTLLGYFTSEVGCTQAVRYLEVPGAFHGDVPYKSGDPAWEAT